MKAKFTGSAVGEGIKCVCLCIYTTYSMFEPVCECVNLPFMLCCSVVIKTQSTKAFFSTLAANR